MNSRFRLSRIEGFLAAGWPIVPGAWWDQDDLVYRCGQDNCCYRMRGLHPVGGDLRPVTNTRPWQRLPATVLLVTGLGIDVLEVDLRTVALNSAMLHRLSKAGSVALLDVVLPRLLLPVASPHVADLDVEAAATGVGGFACRTGVAGVGRHGAGSWVALPSARLRGGSTRWVTSPRAVEWALPEVALVMEVLTAGPGVANRPPTDPITGGTAIGGPWGRRFLRGGVL